MSNVAASLTVVSVTRTDSSVASAEPSAPLPELSGTAAPSDTDAGPAGGGIGIQVLGPVEARVAGEPVPVPGARQLSVLAALALNAGRVVTIGSLVGAVWDGVPPPTARAQIQGSIAQLRRCLPGLIRTKGQGYLLAAAQVDAAVFRQLSGQAYAAAQNQCPAEAAALYRSALGLWRGDALSGVTGLGADAADLEKQRTAAVQGLFAAELGAGHHAQVIPDLFGHVMKRPWHEPLRGLLMLALYRCGRETEALTAYTDGCRELAEHLSTEPGAGLHRLARAIHFRDPGLDTPSPPLPCAPAGIPLH